MPTNEDLLKQANIEDIAQKGTAIYEKIKGNYGPEHRGKFLAIDVASEDVYIADASSEAVEEARKAHPNKVFFVVKIGFSAAESLASLYAHRSYS